MKGTTKKIIIAIGCVVVVAFLIVGYGGKARENKRLRNQVESLQEDKKNLENELASKTEDSEELSETQAKVSNLETELEESQAKVSTLETELQDSQAKVEELEKKPDTSSNQDFLNIKFWYKGTYTVRTEDFTFYSDCFCSNSIGKVTLTTDIYDQVKLSNGMTVYAYMSENGIVWAAKRPSLQKQ